MSDWDDRAQRVLERVRPLHGPGPADAARVRAALGARIAADPGLLVASSIAPSAAAGLAKVLAIFGAGSVAGFGAGFYVAEAFSAAPPARSDLVASVISAPAPSVTVVPPAPELAAPVMVESTRSAPLAVTADEPPAPIPQRRATRSAAEAKARATTGSDLKLELEGLRRAQELLHEGDATWAIARLDELERSGASSALIEERMATRAQAECVLGRSTALGAFAEKFPHSAHLERARASCARAGAERVPKRENAAEQTEAPRSRHE